MTLTPDAARYFLDGNFTTAVGQASAHRAQLIAA